MNNKADRLAGLHLVEFHYFRVPRERWELMLTRACQMGATGMRTVVPWSWHEARNAVFDLTGITHPARDLVDFVESCQAMGLQVVLQLSPYAGAGLLEGGVPGWLVRKYPEIRAMAPDSQPRRDPVSAGHIPSAGHPTYIKHVERWYREVTNALSTRQEPAGPIVALQVNRLGPDRVEPRIGGVPAHWDYNPHVIKVQWPVWLRQQYEGIEALNAAWNAGYHSFSEVPFPAGPLAPSALSCPEEDAARFVAYAAAHALETYAGLLQDMGWTVPIATEQDAFPAAMPLSHLSQVDPEPPQLGAGIRWGMDAPLRADGTARRSFWTVKSGMLEAEDGVKRLEGASLATGFEARRIRLPRPAGNYDVYRLLLDGELLEASARTRGDALYLDYVLEDEDGETDMYVIFDDSSAPLSGLLHDYLASILMGRARVLERGATMCHVVTEALSETPLPGDQERAAPSGESFQAIEFKLEEARRAARQAAASVGRLERLVGEIRGEIPPTPTSILPGASTFTSAELEILRPVHDACAGAAPILMEASQTITDWCQGAQPGDEPFTVRGYRTRFNQAREAAQQAEALLAGALSRLRLDLVAGDLPAAAWAFQDWLARTLQGMTAGWLE